MSTQTPAELVLGTAQLGLAYGAANRTGQPSDRQSELILRSAVGAGVKWIDTAAAYGSSEHRIGAALPGSKGVRIVTKLAPLDDIEESAPIGTVRQAVANSIHASCARLGINASGLALLASLPEEDVERILAQHGAARAPFPFDDIQLRRMLAATRRNGYAYNDVHLFKGMEKMTDMAAIAMPICCSDGTAVAALHLTAITQRLQPPRRSSVVSLLRREAREIETKFRPILDAMRPHREPAGNVDVTLPTPSPKRGNRQG